MDELVNWIAGSATEVCSVLFISRCIAALVFANIIGNLLQLAGTLSKGV